MSLRKKNAKAIYLSHNSDGEVVILSSCRIRQLSRLVGLNDHHGANRLFVKFMFSIVPSE